MYAADLESKEFNKIKPAEKQEEIINRIEDKLVLHSTQEARLIIAELAAIVKGNKEAMYTYEKEIQKLNNIALEAQNRVERFDEIAKTESNLR